MTTETRLGKLHVRLQQVPAKRERAKLLNRLELYAGKVAEYCQRLEASTTAEENATSVFPDLPAGSSADSRRKAARSATRLAKQLRERIESVRDPATEAEIVALGTFAKNAEQNVGDRWARRLEDTVRRYEALVSAAQAAGLERGGVLARRLQDLRERVGAPPGTAGEAGVIRQAVDGLVGLVEELGLEGKPGTFLVEAARGAGDPKALCDPDVQEFVERHGLWKLLVVKFR